MNSIFVLTLSDVLGLIVLGGVVIIYLLVQLWGAFADYYANTVVEYMKIDGVM